MSGRVCGLRRDFTFSPQGQLRGTSLSGGDVAMNNLILTASAIAVLSCLASMPAAAQKRENYATDLKGAQRELLQQNPSGLTRDQLTIGHELNGYMRPQ